MNETKTKQKKGKVVRLSDFAAAYVVENRDGSLRETIDSMIVRFLTLIAEVEAMKVRFVLSSDLYRSLKEARGAAVLRSVRGKKTEIEEPIEVKVSE